MEDNGFYATQPARITAAINAAMDAGETGIEVYEYLSAETVDILEAMGYTVEDVTTEGTSDFTYLISGW